MVQTGEEDGVPVINGVQFARNSTSEYHSEAKTRKPMLIFHGALKVLSMWSMLPRKLFSLVRRYWHPCKRGCLISSTIYSRVHK